MTHITINETLVQALIRTQFPQWSQLGIQQVLPGGWDNRTFRLGEDMLARLPSASHYAAQVEKEQQWLPKLAPLLPFQIPEPIALGKPTQEYPWKWSIYRWIKGEPASSAHVPDMNQLAKDLARFLCVLQSIDATDGPLPGSENFYRGGRLEHYDSQVREALSKLGDRVDINTPTEIWENAVASTWSKSPVWVHGDMSANNLLVQDGRLCAVIDFGQLAVGDPACDVAIAWTFFKKESRKTFKETIAFDEDTWNRGRAWALWKALIVAAGLISKDAVEMQQSLRVLEEIFEEHKTQ